MAISVSQKLQAKDVRTMILRRRIEWALIYGVLLVFGVLVGVPFVYMISGSFKTNGELFGYPLNLLVQNPTVDNYRRLLGGQDIPYVQMFLNSVFVSTSQTLLSLTISSMVGWGFAKYE